jgi:hypothetical protein
MTMCSDYIIANLSYDGALYPGVQSYDGNNMQFVSNVSIPKRLIGVGNKTVYWQIKVINPTGIGSTYWNSSINNQTVKRKSNPIALYLIPIIKM